MDMKSKVVLASLFLMFASALCLSQTATGKQQDLATHLQKAQNYLREKRPELAIPELQAAAAIDPDNVETQGNLGVLLFFQGKPAEAIVHLRAAVDRQPSLAKLQGVLGIAELRTLDLERGRKDLEAAFPLLQDKKFKMQVGLELIGIYTRSGDLDLAPGILAQLRKIDPENPELLFASYRTYSDLAGEAMLALSLAAPDSAQMHQVIAHEETRQGNTNGAIAHYRKAIELNPHLPGVHFELAELLHTSLDVAVKAEAEGEYQRAIAENAQDEKALLRLAEIDVQKGNEQQAITEYTRAAELQPDDADAKLGLARILLDRGQTDAAQKLLEQAIRLEPTNAVAHYRMATLYRKLGRVEDAKREVEVYKKLKETKEKLNGLYKELQIQPKEIQADAQE
jgi:tetratricopeptide (TPR) repeat protein